MASLTRWMMAIITTPVIASAAKQSRRAATDPGLLRPCRLAMTSRNAASHHTDRVRSRKSRRNKVFRANLGLAADAYVRGNLGSAVDSMPAGARPSARRPDLGQGSPGPELPLQGWGPRPTGRGLSQRVSGLWITILMPISGFFRASISTKTKIFVLWKVNSNYSYFFQRCGKKRRLAP